MPDPISALVMKVKSAEKTMVVVTEAGDFWEVPLSQPEPAIGAQVEVFPPVNAATAPKEPKVNVARPPLIELQRWLLPLAACFLLLLIGGINYLFFGFEKQNPIALDPPVQVAVVEPAYTITIDINPSLELWLDNDLNYLGHEALNEDGVLLMDMVKPGKGTPLILVAQQLVQAAKESQYLSETEENLVMTTLVKSTIDTEADLQAINRALVQIESTLLLTLEAENVSADVAIRTTSKEEVAKAKSNNLSINKSFVLEELESRGITVDTEELRGEKIGKLLQETGIPPGQIIKEMKHTKNTKA
ncbi:MAG: hypothetical protein SCK28_15935, partial [Bacillota bacterium]|nr:hypothetical protein [Bacillota bacterium]